MGDPKANQEAAIRALAEVLVPYLAPLLHHEFGIQESERISHKRLAAEQGISTRAAIGLVRSLPGAAAVGHGRGRLWTAPAAEVRAALAGKHTESDATPEADPFERAMARSRLKRGIAKKGKIK